MFFSLNTRHHLHNNRDKSWFELSLNLTSAHQCCSQRIGHSSREIPQLNISSGCLFLRREGVELIWHRCLLNTVDVQYHNSELSDQHHSFWNESRQTPLENTSFNEPFIVRSPESQAVNLFFLFTFHSMKETTRIDLTHMLFKRSCDMNPLCDGASCSCELLRPVFRSPSSHRCRRRLSQSQSSPLPHPPATATPLRGQVRKRAIKCTLCLWMKYYLLISLRRPQCC